MANMNSVRREQSVLTRSDGKAVPFPGEAERWMRLAYDVARILDELQLAVSDGSLGKVLHESDRKETMEGLRTAFHNLWCNAAASEVLLFDSETTEVADAPRK